MRTPWKAIFTSVPMWALIIVHCGQNWGYWTLITELPTYMNDVLEYNLVDVSKNLFYLLLILLILLNLNIRPSKRLYSYDMKIISVLFFYRIVFSRRM